MVGAFTIEVVNQNILLTTIGHTITPYNRLLLSKWNISVQGIAERKVYYYRFWNHSWEKRGFLSDSSTLLSKPFIFIMGYMLISCRFLIRANLVPHQTTDMCQNHNLSCIVWSWSHPAEGLTNFHDFADKFVMSHKKIKQVIGVEDIAWVTFILWFDQATLTLLLGHFRQN